MSVLHLVRYAYTPDETLGLLKFPVEEDGSSKYALWTVETKWNDNLPFQSCIPDGQYSLQAFESAKHPDSWVITPVEGRTGILIHSGNSCADVTGCIAPGLTRTDVKVWESRDAMRLLNYELSRNKIHTVVIGSGMGAVLHSGPESELPGDDDAGETERKLRAERGEGADRAPS